MKYLGTNDSCGEQDCPVHGKAICLKIYNRSMIEKSLRRHPVGFRPFIVSFLPGSNDIEIAYVTNCVRDILRKYDSLAWIKMESHITAKNPHVNFGIASRYLHRDYEKSKRRKTKKRYSWQLAWRDIGKLVGSCVRKIEYGYKKYFDNHQGWLHYVLRLETGDSFHKRKEYGRGCDGRSFRLSHFLKCSDIPIRKRGRENAPTRNLDWAVPM
jgi:hypothetical protein